MCNTIQELDKKNDEAHNEIRLDLHNGLRALEDNSTARHLELSNKLDNSIEKMNAATENIKAATTMTTMYKTIIGILLAIIAGTGVLSLTSLDRAAQARVDTSEELMKINKRNDNLNATFATKEDVQTLMDTIQVHWKKENKFYDKEFVPQMQWTRSVWKTEIRPNTLFRLEQTNKN